MVSMMARTCLEGRSLGAMGLSLSPRCAYPANHGSALAGESPRVRFCLARKLLRGQKVHMWPQGKSDPFLPQLSLI